MITIITGVPGSGKTALCVDLITREYKDRIIFNDGLDDLALENTPVDAMKWHEDVPDGGLIIVDEVQRKWRPRGPAAKVPESIAALETHRHRGIDFIVITQNLRLVDQNVRSLAGRHLHIRDTGFLGRWLYEWPEADLNNNWKRCENKRRYKLPKHVFSLYKSASLHTKPVRTKPMVLYFLAFLLVAFVVLVGFLYQRLNPAKAQAETTSAATEVAAAAQVLQGLQEPASSGQETAKRLIDDRVDWLPRVTTHPESAPAYDDVRQVVTFPRVIGGICMAGVCKCFTQQGTNTGLSHQDCQREMENPRFDAYSVPTPTQAQAQPVQTSSGQEQPQYSTAPYIGTKLIETNHRPGTLYNPTS